MTAGEFSLRHLEVRSSIIATVVVAGLLIGVPSIIYFIIQNGSSGSLTPDGSEAMSAFLLYAWIIGAVISFTSFLYGGYQKGTRPRLLLGMASGALIVAYSIVVLIASGIESALSDIGVRLDANFAALTMVYASVVLMFSVGGEYLASRSESKKLNGAAPAGPGGIE